MTFYPDVAATSSFNGPSYWQIDNAESFVYLAYFTSTEPFPAATTTAAAITAAPSSPAAPVAAFSPQAKVSIGLSVPLGVCACALLGILLLRRYRRRTQQLSRIGRTGAGAGADDDVAGESEDKMTAESGSGNGSGDVSELHGAEVRGDRNELEGSVAEGRNELG